MVQKAAPFRQSTHRNRYNLNSQPLPSFGQSIRFDLQQVGYLAYIIVQVTGSITTGSGATGTWSPYFPYNMLQSLALRSNEGLEIYRTSGYTNQTIQSVYRYGFNPAQASAPVNSNATAAGMKTGVVTAPSPGATIASSTRYPIQITYLIPVATDWKLSAGLLLLQNQATRLTVEAAVNNLTGAGITGVISNGGNLGTGAVTQLSVGGSVEFFAVPNDPGSQPDTSLIHRWIEDTQPWVASGEFLYKVPVNGVISRLIMDHENNGAPMPFFSTPGDPTTQTMQNITVTYAASQSPEVEDLKPGLWRQRFEYSADLNDGILVREFSLGAGSVEQGFDGRDTYDTSALTEFAVRELLSMTPTNGKIRVTRQELQKRAA